MSGWPTCRGWLLVDKELGPQARALAAMLGAPTVAATRSPKKGEGLVCLAGSAKVREGARQAEEGGVPLLLAGLMPLDAPPAPLAKDTLVVALLPVDPAMVLREGEAAASAAAVAALEAGGLEDPVGWGAALCKRFSLDEERAGELLAQAHVHPSPYEAGTALSVALALQGVAAAARRRCRRRPRTARRARRVPRR